MEQGNVGHFRRVFPPSELFSSLTLRSILWSTLSTALLLVQLGVVYLFLGLLLYGGRITVGQPDFQEFSRRTGVAIPAASEFLYADDDAGLVPFAWEKRKYSIGRVILPMCRYFPPPATGHDESPDSGGTVYLPAIAAIGGNITCQVTKFAEIGSSRHKS